MNRLLWSLAAMGALLAAQSAQAQGFGGYVPPPTNPYPNYPLISPYLNLARPGNPAVNYYNLVVPQQTYNTQLQQLQVSTQQLGFATNTLAAQQQQQPVVGPLLTGHPVRFMDFNRYFLTLGPGRNFPGPVNPNGLQLVNPQNMMGGMQNMGLQQNMGLNQRR
jgi:hypothetical protein